MSKQTDIDIELVVATREDIAEGVVGLHLEYPDGTPLPNWTPGSHIDVVLNEELVRQYSLVELDEDASRWHIGVLREVEGRGGSREIHDAIAPGMKIRARGPRNHFQLQPADGYIFIAGGIGITPITSMIAEAERRATPWKLTYGGRTRASMAFSEDLVERYGERVSLVPQDELGLIDLDAILGEPREGILIYCCGPGPLLDAVQRATAHWPEDALHIERFVPLHQDGARPDDSFEVELSESGIVVDVPADKSILRVLDEAGIDVLSSCGEGTCGTCETMIVAGEADHRDSVLTPKEQADNRSMMICVSRAACPRLVLEL
ncbi:PDR/VanB family oxidoreductase [Rhodococcus sp. NCIMB 12038]|uniref:PDR/VanB family oxidoreductase n=1 Tax=Rhodococcus sp. NCIMB 12038 TaxID=933800 RepID=UPI000B3C0622|nr:PDR/VanB family oxidoreductase [Rhodococcus sp. NCIMB 12038]OUS91351.1 oxidoreductase [Rhodococcus sp. NCIMB 12038]